MIVLAVGIVFSAWIDRKKGDCVKADKWEFKTILSIEFKCKNCASIYKIDKDVTVDRYETDKFIVHCNKCKFVNEVERN